MDLADMEAQIMLLGLYKSFEELEDNLTLEEINLILKAEAAKEERLHRVLAAVNGIKWDDNTEGGIETGEAALERLAGKVEAQLNGISEEQTELEMFGIKFE